MQYHYGWSNPSARKKLLVRGNKFKTMYRTVRSEAPYQLQRLMTTAWMKMFCYIAKFNRQSAYLLYNRRKQEVSITADPETHSIWDDRRLSQTPTDSLFILLSVCILNRGYRLHHNFGLLNTNSDPVSKHMKQKKKVKKRAGYAKLYSAVYSSIVKTQLHHVPCPHKTGNCTSTNPNRHIKPSSITAFWCWCYSASSWEEVQDWGHVDLQFASVVMLFSKGSEARLLHSSLPLLQEILSNG